MHGAMWGLDPFLVRRFVGGSALAESHVCWTEGRPVFRDPSTFDSELAAAFCCSLWAGGRVPPRTRPSTWQRPQAAMRSAGALACVASQRSGNSELRGSRSRRRAPSTARRRSEWMPRRRGSSTRSAGIGRRCVPPLPETRLRRGDCWRCRGRARRRTSRRSSGALRTLPPDPTDLGNDALQAGAGAQERRCQVDCRGIGMGAARHSEEAQSPRPEGLRTWPEPRPGRSRTRRVRSGVGGSGPCRRHRRPPSVRRGGGLSGLFLRMAARVVALPAEALRVVEALRASTARCGAEGRGSLTSGAGPGSADSMSPPRFRAPLEDLPMRQWAAGAGGTADGRMHRLRFFAATPCAPMHRKARSQGRWRR